MSAQPKEQELTQFKREFAEAVRRKDRAILGELIHDGFIFLDPEGKVLDKDEILQALTHPLTHLHDGFTRVEKESAVSSDGKAVTEVADVEMAGTLAGEDKSGLYINTATYVRGPGGWQLMSNTWQRGQSCPGCCGSMTVRKKCAVCGREGVDGLLVAH